MCFFLDICIVVSLGEGVKIMGFVSEDSDRREG